MAGAIHRTTPIWGSRRDAKMPETTVRVCRQNRRFHHLHIKDAREKQVRIIFSFHVVLIIYFSYGTIFAADETAVFLDPTYGKCIDQKGAKEVNLTNL